MVERFGKNPLRHVALAVSASAKHESAGIVLSHIVSSDSIASY